MIIRFIRNLLVQLVSFTGAAFWYRRYYLKKGPLVRVLAFHDVPDKDWFAGIVKNLIKHHYVLTPKEFNERKFTRGKINILLTFDDGYQSWIKNVTSILEKENVKGLFFISSGLVSCSDNPVVAEQYCIHKLRRSYQPILDWEGVQSLVAAGHTVGGHTVNHHDLSTCSESELRFEIQEDKQSIENKIKSGISDFAYPFGTTCHYNEVVTKAVVRAGYTQAFTAESSFVVFNESKELLVPRLCIENVASPAQVKLWVQGGYDIVSFIKKIIWLRKIH